ncbi:MAG: RNA-binding protein, partial [Saprospiraceae bacterium]
SRSKIGEYGIAPRSYLFINDGKGKFTEQTEAIIPEFSNLGMLTDATVLEKAADGSMQEFVVVGEFLPLTIFTKNDDKFVKKELPNSSGWWNCVTAVDMDGDGDLDFLAGNQGLNADLQPADNQPIELYVKDFDQNGSSDPILTYFKQNKKYTYASKDELIGQIVSLRKRYNDYNSFAQSTFSDIFPAEQISDAIHLRAETFTSVYVENLGNGEFRIQNLPLSAQVAPLQSFAVTDVNQDGNLDVLSIGNFYGNQPNLGRADAAFGDVLLGSGKGDFTVLPAEESGFIVEGDARDVEVLELENGRKLVIISKNNMSTQVLFIN